MDRTLVVFFSAGGTTAKVAKGAAKLLDADLFEIKPEKPYDASDIKWMNPLARCNKEKIGKKDVPVVGKVENFEDYSHILIGFPIWYGCAPNVVNTFCKGYDWSGKEVLAFATSGGSGIGSTAKKLEPYVSGAISIDAKLVHSDMEVKNWVDSK
ncbi:MAG: flavodoxin [Lachnospiraceae bacterium]|jgi:flavodoxin|nr:flavodoxin [Lachnospiraceae bacterium]